jgi:hypothetical protein
LSGGMVAAVAIDKAEKLPSIALELYFTDT